MSTDSSDADIIGPQRPPRVAPTIDLDPSEVSGDSVRQAETAHARERKRFGLPVALRTLLISMLGCALAAALLIAASWLAGWPSSSDPQQSAALGDISTRLSKLESRPAAAAGVPASRVDSLEASVTGLKNNLSALQKASEATAASLTEIKSQPRAGAPVDLSPLTERLARLEQFARSNAGNAQPDASIRNAIAAIALDVAVRQGSPFVETLALIKKTGADTVALAPLEGFASSGVPGDARLSRDLQALLPQLTVSNAAKPDAPTAGSNLVDRLTASAARFVRVERADAPSASSVTDDRNAILARIQAALRSNEVGSAQREVLKLPDSDRAALKSWIENVARRDAALDASRKFVSASLASISDTSSSSKSSAQ